MIKDKLTLQLCRFSLVFIWIYQGLVPKLLGPHADELTMNQAFVDAAPWFWLNAEQISFYGGIGEVVFGVLVLLFYKSRWVYTWTIIAMIGLFVATAWFTPQFLGSAFNVVTINLAVIVIAWIAKRQLGGDEDTWVFGDV